MVYDRNYPSDKYYYIIIDKQEKTLELMEINSCEAIARKLVAKQYGYDWNSGEFDRRFRLYFNYSYNYIDRDKIYKYAKKFEDITDYDKI